MGGVVTTSLSKSNDVAGTVLIQPDGKIIDAGQTWTGNSTVMGLVRYNADGSLDSTFGSRGIAVSKIGAPSDNHDFAALYPSNGTDSADNGKIVQADGGTIARFNTNGSLDTSFGNKGSVTVPGIITGVVVQPDGKIVVSADNGSTLVLSRFNTNGSLDTTFGSGGTATLPGGAAGGYDSGLALQPDGKLVVAGETGADTWEVARFNSNGTLDTTFDSAGAVPGTVTIPFAASSGALYSLAIYPSTGPDTADYGKIVAVGMNQGNSGRNTQQIALARINANGTLDNTFGQSGEVVTPFPNGAGQGNATAIQTDGKIVVAGWTLPAVGSDEFSLLRYNTDGSLDTTFGNGGIVATPNGTGTSEAFSVAIQPDGRIVAAGYSQGSTGWDFMTARYLVGPQIGSFTANPNPVTAGSPVTLSASNISDGDPSSSITQVAFYLDSNNDSKLEPGTDTLLGYATQTSPGVWTLTNSSAFGLTAGTYTLFAQAQDNDGYLGDPIALTLTVQ
jgi:uncharacterized delta-60 repeat protein